MKEGGNNLKKIANLKPIANSPRDWPKMEQLDFVREDLRRSKIYWKRILGAREKLKIIETAKIHIEL